MGGWRRFRNAFGSDPGADVDDELSFHVEMRTRELIARGEARDRARELALRRFGDYAASREACLEIEERRDRRRSRRNYMAELRQDIAYALRMLRRKPGFTAVAVLTLGLGIGATSAIFGVVNAVVISALPYAESERLYRLNTRYPDGTDYSLSAPDFVSLSTESQAFEEVVAYTGTTTPLLGEGTPQELRLGLLSRGFVEVLGLSLLRGRSFESGEHEPGRDHVLLLSHALWQREFGAAPVLDRTLDLAGQPYTVVGVLAEGSGIPGDWDMYAPLPYDSTFDATTTVARRSEFLGVIGRARSGLTAGVIDADVDAVGTRLQTEFPNTNAGLTFSATPLRDVMIGDARTPLLVLLGAVGFVLLVACANVANLVLARASGRHGEIAVRTALGAGRGRLLRQMITEALVLGLLGGALGLAIAYGVTSALVASQVGDIPRLDEVGVDRTVAMFTLAISIVTALLFGTIPAMQATGARLSGALRSSGRGAGGAGNRVRSALVVTEMVLAVVLLTGAGLLIRSFVERMRVDPGFETDNALTFRLTMQGPSYTGAEPIRDFVGRVFDEIRALPGVVEVGGTTTLPANGLGGMINFSIGNDPPPPGMNGEIGIANVTPEYFQVLGASMLSGRTFTGFDDADAPPVAIVNETAVERWFGGEDPVGRRATIGIEREIVGVVSDMLQRTPGTPPAPQAFAPWAQRTSRTVRAVVRTVGDPLTLVRGVRNVIAALDPNLALSEVGTLNDVVADAMARERFYTAVLTLFAGLALALAAIGIFGVMSYGVAQRAREIGIRIALGASANGVVRLIVVRAMALAGIGLVLGVAGALALARFLQSQLYQVGVVDPATLAGVVIVLCASAATASFLPARRAAATDPGLIMRDS